jgi:hypothetical protein
MFGWLGRFFRKIFMMKPKREHEMTPARLEALDKARQMKEIRKEAAAAPGGKGPIRNRPAAVKLYGGKKKK